MNASSRRRVHHLEDDNHQHLYPTGIIMADKDFHHPYEPYDIQLQFIRAVYDCIEQGKVGVFESPTGELEEESG